MKNKKIEAKAENALDVVLEFYAGHGLVFDKRPVIKYLPRNLSTSAEALGAIDPKGETSREFIHLRSILLQEIYWRECHGILLSPGAIQEFYEAAKIGKGYQKPYEFRKYDADIFLFKPFSRIAMDKDLSRSTLAHEVWHLFEARANVLDKNPLIVEGTATYAENFFLEEECDNSFFSEDYEGEHNKLLYEGIGELVGRQLAGRDYGLSDLLVPKFRDLLERKAKSLIGRRLRQDEGLAQDMRDYLGVGEFLNVLRYRREEFLTAMRRKGAERLASELEAHDLDSLLGACKEKL